MARKKTTAPKAFCFVLMPFDDSFTDIYQLGIREACAVAGAYCERVDEQIFHESILDRIYNQIAKADIVVADMTGRNANLFYEVRYAHALGKRTILLTQNADDIPFDLKHFPHIVYGSKITTLRDELTARVQWCVENPPESGVNAAIDIDLFIGGVNLSSGDGICQYGKGHLPYPDLTIHNRSATTFEPGSFKIGLITGDEFVGCRSSDPIVTTRLPDGGYAHMLPEFPTLFPQGYASYRFVVDLKDDEPTVGTKHEVMLRVYTPAGTRDYPLTFEKVEADPNG